MAPFTKRRKLQHVGERLVLENGNNTVAIESLDDEASLINDDSSSEEDVPPKSLGGSYSTLLRSLGPATARQGPLNKLILDNGSPTILPESNNKHNATDVPSDSKADIVEAVEDEEEDPSDPFVAHFAELDGDILARQINSSDTNEWKIQKIQLDGLSKFSVIVPGGASASAYQPPSTVRSSEALKLKQRLLERVRKTMPKMSAFQTIHSTPIFNYQDLLCGSRHPQNAGELRQLACLHALNHVLKTRDFVIKNNAKLAKEPVDSGLELRDQGFTRPKVLILLETRQSCARYMETITELWEPDQQENRKRFEDAFVRRDQKFSEDKPIDFRELFEGNDDNEFRLGIKFTRKTLKYYSKFYNSDIIFASPLGLRRAINADDPKKKDADFLSSIEILIMDQADAMLQQNFAHVTHALSYLNLLPTSSHDTDFSRVRNYYLEKNIKYLRQTIIFSAYLTPDLNSLFSAHAHNVFGKWKTLLEHPGAMLNMNIPHLRQTFTRFASKSPSTDPDERFQYFISTVLASLKRHLPDSSASSSSTDPSSSAGVLIFVPSYFDFVRLQNHLTNKENLTFGTLSEYTPTSEVSRARSFFRNGTFPLLLYSGRLHHFRRYLIRGAKRIVFYGLPDNPLFYEEVAGGFLGATARDDGADIADLSARVVFSKWEAMALERIVGTGRVGRMVQGDVGDTFDFK